MNAAEQTEAEEPFRDKGIPEEGDDALHRTVE
jgi:hypothetical protein